MCVEKISSWAGDGVLFIDVSKIRPDGEDNIHFTAKGYCEKADIMINVLNREMFNNYAKISSKIYANNPLTV